MLLNKLKESNESVEEEIEIVKQSTRDQIRSIKAKMNQVQESSTQFQTILTEKIEEDLRLHKRDFADLYKVNFIMDY